MIKRLFDVIVSATALLLLAPLFAVIGLLVFLDSGLPVLFWQERVGRNFQPFHMVKFRTMVVGAESRGAAVTTRGDVRVTRVGRILRRTKLDELPQLWNVLRGDMSIVGPRPEVERYVQAYRSAFADILRIRPGITDFASIAYRDEEAILANAPDPETAYVQDVLPKKIELARDYLRRAGFWTDMRIVVRTIGVTLR